jgi:hypothetical protein
VKIRIKSCLGCYAYEDGMQSCQKGSCNLGYKTEKIELVSGSYGRNRILVTCDTRPIEICPKPRTSKKYIEEHIKRQKYFCGDL